HQELPVVRGGAVSGPAHEMSEFPILIVENAGLAQGEHKSVLENQGPSGIAPAFDDADLGDDGSAREHRGTESANPEDLGELCLYGLEMLFQTHGLIH